jgi:hypothetical protein
VNSDGGTADFATCPLCRHAWCTREQFLGDPRAELVGYQACFDVLELGLLLFNHAAPGCGTTLSVRVDSLMSLYDGPVYVQRATGSDECPGYCLNGRNLETCPVQCACASIREVIRIVADWPKQND